MELPKTIEELNALIEKSKEGLNNKNKELMDEVKNLKKTMKNFDGIDVEALKQQSEELAELKKQGQEKNGEYQKLYEDLKKTSEKKIQELQGKVEEATTQTKELRRDNVLTESLTKANIDPLLFDAAKALHMPKIQLDDNNNAVVEGKDLNDYLKDWTESDVGKRFVSDGNKGGDGNGPGPKVPPEAAYFDKNSPNYSLTEQGKLANSNPALYEKLKGQAPKQ